MSEPKKSRTHGGLTAAERAILTRVSSDAWAERCRHTRQVMPYALPPLYTPVPRHHALELLAQDGTADSPHRRHFKQGVASLYAFGGRNALDELKPVLPRALTDVDEDLASILGEGACPCCRVSHALNEPESIWHLRHRHNDGTLSDFNPSTQVTEIRSTYYVSGPAKATPDQVDAIMKALAEELDPQNWSKVKGGSFTRSERQPGFTTPERPGGEWYLGDLDWKGQLLESFAWDWNPDATMLIDNLLNVDFHVDRSRIELKYSLAESLSSRLWLARQAGGLDLDRGSCTVIDLGTSELEVDPTQSTIDFASAAARITPRGTFKPVPRHNIVVITTKTERFTPVQFAPGWLSTLINYITPVLGGIWMSQAVQGGILRAIEATAPTAPRQRVTPPQSTTTTTTTTTRAA
jgi:hypothetical protein